MGLTLGQFALAALIALAASILGGIVGGIAVGGRALGNQVAAMMGGFYGPIAGFHGVLAALVALALLALARS